MRDEIQGKGFVVREKYQSHLSTAEVARSFGTIVDVDRLLPFSKIPSVQSLRPRDATRVKQNQYSGNYGLTGFPLHTDLAHWIVPPDTRAIEHGAQRATVPRSFAGQATV